MYRLYNRTLILICTIICFIILLNSMTQELSDQVITTITSHDNISPIKTTSVKTIITTKKEKAEKINWENQNQIELDKAREGPGEHGTAVQNKEIDKKQVQKLLNVNGFNAAVSDLISVQRSILDLRDDECSEKKYNRTLPKVSIIIPFHNEHWTTLLRTVHSLLDRAPDQLIAELILVDDKSDKPFLGHQLEVYMSRNFKKVKILRNENREGLIRTRLVGADISTGDVLVFIDSHCEASYNWLPPLIDPISRDYRVVTCPYIDVIDSDNFIMREQDDGGRGSFDWNFDYKRLPKHPEDEKRPSEPFESPVMAGGLFAISKKWFLELGGYDKGLDIWGGEQYELSFKIWMCGGRMIDIPCSRIGHIYRKFNPFGVSNRGNYLFRNYKRVAEVWMDDWKKYLYQKRPDAYKNIDPGDMKEQKDLRVRLNCKSFDWFIENVAYDLTLHYPVVEPKTLGVGKIKLLSNETIDYCLDGKFGTKGETLKLDECVADGGEQSFIFSWRHELKSKDRTNMCIDYPGGLGHVIQFYGCHHQFGNQIWQYKTETKQFYHIVSNKCLDSNIISKTVFMETCSEYSLSQKWTMENLDENEINNKVQHNRIFQLSGIKI